MPFQQEGLKFALRHEGRVLIGDEMGLGKTYQALSASLCYRDEWPVLIVVPATLRAQWAEVYCEWGTLSFAAYEEAKESMKNKSKDKKNSFDFLEDKTNRKVRPLTDDDVNIVSKATDSVDALVNIVSYSLVAKMKDKLNNAQFQVVICDESHNLKTWDAKRTEVMSPIIRNAKRAFLLTGTPALNRPVELHSQVSAVRPKIFPLFQQFSDRYCNFKFDRFGRPDHKGSSLLAELNVFLTNTVMIRRKKDLVLTQLPPKFRQKVVINLDPKKMKAMEKMRKELEEVRESLKHLDSDDKQEKNDNRFHNHRIINELFRSTGRAKLPSVLNYIKENLIDPEKMPKFVIFAVHQDILDGIESTLNENHIKNIRICGKTPMDQRPGLVEYFQTDEECKVAVLSILAAGVGLTMTSAALVVFAEMYWTPGLLYQAEDRCHRIGQQSNVTIQYLIAKGTIDEDIWKMINNKLKVVGTALDGGKEDLKASHVKSDVKSESNSEFVSLVLEKVDNYEKRRKRMKRREKIRKGLIVDDEGNAIDDDIDLDDGDDYDDDEGDDENLQEGDFDGENIEISEVEESDVGITNKTHLNKTLNTNTTTTTTTTTTSTSSFTTTSDIPVSTSKQRLQQFKYNREDFSFDDK
eukprot:TRINITY_DN1877_c0_g1_i2.p1 TRINITY_DN1877_c0_g1~~TRINITY_DN1877_c0_g1_i2.p1  ORF type:complete len:636 (-),score=129.79 TRINITY_DN1877_c0_g1_i2:240-2147(-)